MLLVLALDGLDPELLDRFAAQGATPRLAALARGGWATRLRSTFPPVSVPAWSTFLTGVGPGTHGLVDFLLVEGRRLRLASGAERPVPTVAELLDAAGLRTAWIGLPTTYPAPRLERGVVLAGFDSPFATSPGPRGAHPPAFWEALHAEGIDLALPSLPEDRKGRCWRWHRRARREILAGIERRVRQARAVLERFRPEVLAVHFQAADTAAHHFVHLALPEAPRHRPAPPEIAGTLAEVYAALDGAVGRLLDAAPAGTTALVVSDHGAAPAPRAVAHLARWLEEEGLLVRRRRSARRVLELARRAASRAPRGLQSVGVRRLGGLAAAAEGALRAGDVDFERSAAWSEESSTLPGIRILDPRRTEEILERVRRWPAVRRAFHRDDVLRGPLRHRAPEILLEMRLPLARTPAGYRGPAVRELAPSEWEGPRGGYLPGIHAPEGVLLAAGPAVRVPRRDAAARPPSLADLAPTILAWAGLEPPRWMEGTPLEPLVGGRPRRRRAVGPPPARSSGEGLAPSEEAAVARRLRAFGYLG